MVQGVLRLTDIVNNRGEDYGNKRLTDVMDWAPTCAQDILTHIWRDVEAFVGPAAQPDDLTSLILTCD